MSESTRLSDYDYGLGVIEQDRDNQTKVRHRRRSVGDTWYVRIRCRPTDGIALPYDDTAVPLCDKGCWDE